MDYSFFTIALILINTLIFIALLIIYSATCFITIKKNILSDLLIDLVSQTAYFLLDFTSKIVKYLFYVIPIYFTLYYPAKILFFEQVNYKLGLYLTIAIFISFLFLFISNAFFNYMLKFYRSAGGK